MLTFRHSISLFPRVRNPDPSSDPLSTVQSIDGTSSRLAYHALGPIYYTLIIFMNLPLRVSLIASGVSDSSIESTDRDLV